MGKKKVIVVEDNDAMAKIIKYCLMDVADVVRADSLEEGWEIFQNNPDADLIIIDACVPGWVPNSMELVSEIIKYGYKKPVLATSTDLLNCAPLIAAGATHQVEKERAIDLALNLLGA